MVYVILLVRKLVIYWQLNLWVSGGYNFAGYDDKDLIDGNTTMEGTYFRFRFKFDENLFNRKNKFVNKALEPK